MCMCMPSFDPCYHLAVIFIRCMMMAMEKDRRFEGQGEGWTQRLLWVWEGPLIDKFRGKACSLKWRLTSC
jgi:hypothetical protein